MTRITPLQFVTFGDGFGTTPESRNRIAYALFGDSVVFTELHDGTDGFGNATERYPEEAILAILKNEKGIDAARACEYSFFEIRSETEDGACEFPSGQPGFWKVIPRWIRNCMRPASVKWTPADCTPEILEAFSDCLKSGARSNAAHHAVERLYKGAPAVRGVFLNAAA